VIDTGCLIELKTIVPVGEQWRLLLRMSALVDTVASLFLTGSQLR
jgi:hypothetical protein